MEFDISPAALLVSLVVSTIGMSLFIYGKKQFRVPQLVTGILLMVYPLFVTGASVMLGIGTMLLGGMWLALRSGA